MKISILLDSKGNVVGATHPAAAGSRTAEQPPAAIAGLTAGPGQTIHDIEVTSDLLEPSAPDSIWKRLSELEAVKSIVSNTMAARLPADRGEEGVGSAFELEYVTNAVSLLANDAIGVRVINDSSVAENTRVVIYQNGGAGATTVVDTSRVVVAPTWMWAMGFTIKNPGDYWLRIQTTSESLIPQATFDRVTSTTVNPIMIYKPGDFAVFRLTRQRLW